MKITIVEQLMDNYAYLITDGESGKAAIIDPAEADKVMKAVEREGLELVAILNTHHHWDHTGGNEDLVAAQPNLRVIGFAPDAERIPKITEPVDEGDTVEIEGLQGVVMSVPCHTTGHVAYRFGDALFSGDTLFAAGCGKFFEGTAADMHKALIKVIGGLPGDTKIYCGHEYTLSNLKFAKHIDPNNPAVDEMIAIAEQCAKEQRPTIPTTIDQERTYNPFMRPDAEGIKAAVARGMPGLDVDDPVLVLGTLRKMKDMMG